VYAAAFDKGYTPASVVLDAPIVMDELGMEKAWRPGEDNNRFEGPIRLREALAFSKTLVSVRLTRALGLDYVRNYDTRFGFDKSQLPDDLTMALGTAELSPLQMAVGYSTFANGGFKISPYYIDRIEDAGGKVLVQADPAIACFSCNRVVDPPLAKLNTAGARSNQVDEAAHDGKSMIPIKNLAPQIISPQIAYLLADMMKDVIRRGTAIRARSLNRDDIAGKTGTTNDHHDAWFNGFNGDLVTSVWTGFDSDRTLGDGEEGSHVALPIWTYYIRETLAGVPRHGVPVPDGIVSVRISPQTGLLASSDNPNGIMEKFIEGNLPKPEVYEGNTQNPADGDKPLF
jgi:penicillin-binding protein 1A